MPNILEYYTPPQFRTQSDIENKDLRDQDRQVLYSLGMTDPGAPIVEIQEEKNLLSLNGGSHGGAILFKEGTLLRGVSGGSVIDGLVELEADAIVDGIYFDSGALNHGAHIKVGKANTPVKAILRNCIFNKNKAIDTSIMIEVAVGSQAGVVGCMFQGGPGSASPILNDPANAASDVQVVACFNKTGAAFAHVQATGCL